MSKLPKNIGFVRRSLPVLPPSEFGVSYVKSFSPHRCDLGGIGLAEQRDPRKYQWDNAQRSAGVLFQFTFEGRGALTDATRGRTWALPAGHAFLVEMPSATSYGLPVESRSWRFVWAMLHGDAATDLTRSVTHEHGPVLRLSAQSAPIATLLRLHRSLQQGSGLDEWTANIEAHRFLLELHRELRQPRSDTPAEIAAARLLLERRAQDASLRVEHLAQRAGYSKFHFTRLFKRHLGASPHQFLLRLRIRRALELLTTTDLPVKQIARRVGFNDVSWFGAAFRKLVRTSPAAVRKQRRGLSIEELLTG